MRKKTFYLTMFLVAAAFTASAQTTGGTITNTHGMVWNASDWNLPPAVIRYLKEHPRLAKKIIAYYKEHGEWPPFPPKVPTVTAPVVQAQAVAPVQWPAAPPPPPAVPVSGLK